MKWEYLREEEFDAAVKLSVDRLASIFELVKNDDECLKMAEEALPC